MILLDTSVWVDYLRRGGASVVQVLESGQAAAHAFVIGELACGNLHSRVRVIELLQGLPRLAMATDDEVLYFIERHKLRRAASAMSTHTCLRQPPSDGRRYGRGRSDCDRLPQNWVSPISERIDDQVQVLLEAMFGWLDRVDLPGLVAAARVSSRR